MRENTYNGYHNRSTWLAKLHLDNTNKETSERAVEFAVVANTQKQFTTRIKELLRHTQVSSEQDYNVDEVDFAELWDSLRIT